MHGATMKILGDVFYNDRHLMILVISFIFASSSMRLTISMLSVLLRSSKQLFLFLP